MAALSEIVGRAAPIDGGCGIYFLQRSSAQGLHVVYVGQSVNVYARVAQHAAEARKRFDFWSWIECHKYQLDLMESLYIHWLSPDENGLDTAGEKAAPIPRRHLQHLLEALAPTNSWRKRRSVK